MSYHFNNIVLITKKYTAPIVDTLKAVYLHLKCLGVNVLVETETAEYMNDPNIPTIKVSEYKELIDLAIVVGGDGSLLHTARIVANQHIPVVGINRGRLGFLTDVLPDDLEKLTAVLEGHYTVEKRFLLYAQVHQQNQVIGEGDALNDVILLPNDVAHMIEFEIYIDDLCMCSIRSDGMIVATPTGSTAYALSGGGPILHPQLDAIVLVPMFPHSLTYRPVVVDGNSEIRILVAECDHKTPGISCDGQPRIPMGQGDSVKIIKNRNYLKLIHPIGYNYYEALRSKLHWGKKL